jgi:hypothetical protein
MQNITNPIDAIDSTKLITKAINTLVELQEVEITVVKIF